MRGLWVILLFSFLVGFAPAPCLGASSFDLVFVADVGGLKDGGINDACLSGVQRAAKELGVGVKVLNSVDLKDPFLSFHENTRRGDIVISVGFLMEDVFMKASILCPERRFILVDGMVNGRGVASILFKEEEIGFLAGLFASAATKTNRIGYVGGVKGLKNDRLLIGYKAGGKVFSALSGKKIEVLDDYVGTFNDPGKGKEVGKALLDKGVDVIFQRAGQSGLGVMEAAREGIRKAFFIGVDIDRRLVKDNNLLVNIVRRVDLATYLAIISLVKEDSVKVSYMGLRDGVVEVEEGPAFKETLSGEKIDLIERAKDLVISGKLVVPSSTEELSSFVPNI